MHPDLVDIYNYLDGYVVARGLMGQDVNIRVEESIYIKLYINDEGGIKGQYKKPLMNVYFSAPGLLTVKFILLDTSLYGELAENFHLAVIERNSFRVDFDSIDKFKKFIELV
jgi:hypothetical protein